VKIKFTPLLFYAMVVALYSIETLHAQNTAFTYQGQFNDGGYPANGNYDLTFAVYDTFTPPGDLIAGPITNSAVAVSNGLFTATLNFGNGAFTGADRWLEITARATGGTNFTTLSPRQKLTPTPYAIFANTASNLLGTLAATQLNGALPSAQISGAYSGSVTFNNNANNFNGTFSGAFNGNGAGLTNLDATQLASGTVADARLSSNVALLNANQTFIGSNFFNGPNTFTNSGNNFSGRFFGNGLVGWLVQTGATVQAVSDTGYLLTNSQLVTVTLPFSPNIGDIVRISGAGVGGWEIAQNTNQSVLGNFFNFTKSSWTLTSASVGTWYTIASSADGTKLLAAIYGGGIYFSPDSGVTWTETYSLSTSWHSVAGSSDGTKMVAVAYGGDIYTNSGSGWSAISGSGANWTSVASSSDGSRLAATIYGGAIYTSTNFGATWTQQAGAPTGGNWWSIASSADGSKLIAADYGVGIYISTNSGVTWSQPFGSLNWYSVASSADGSKLAAVVYGGGIYTSSTSGASWIEQTNASTSANWYSVASSADGSKLAAVVYGGGIYLSSNYGVAWIQQTNLPVKSWNAITSSADGSKLAAVVYNATSGGIYVSQAAPQTTTTLGANGYLIGGQGSAVELQYVGNGQFMPVSFAGSIWAY
jgi:hypothetical protein